MIVSSDGAFDLFTADHIALLEAVMCIERTQHAGVEPYLIVGVHYDTTLPKCKTMSLPVMNSLERASMLLPSRTRLKNPFICSPCLTSLLYISAVVLSASVHAVIGTVFLSLYRSELPSIYFEIVVYGESLHKEDGYAELKEMDLLWEGKNHSWTSNIATSNHLSWLSPLMALD